MYCARIALSLVAYILFTNITPANAEHAQVQIVNNTKRDFLIAAVVHKPAKSAPDQFSDPKDGIWRNGAPKRGKTEPKAIQFFAKRKATAGYGDWWVVIFAYKDAKDRPVVMMSSPKNGQRAIDTLVKVGTAALKEASKDKAKSLLVGVADPTGLLVPFVREGVLALLLPSENHSRAGYKEHGVGHAYADKVVQLIVTENGLNRMGKPEFRLLIRSQDDTSGRTEFEERIIDFDDLYKSLVKKTKEGEIAGGKQG